MILLDTNVLSELMRPTPEAAVERWLADQPTASVFISAITEAELRYGVALLPAGKRRSALAATIEAMLAEDFGGRILPFDSQAAIAFAESATARRQAGRYPRLTPRSPPSPAPVARC
jgi:predicted nucleic acid-binding protein